MLCLVSKVTLATKLNFTGKKTKQTHGYDSLVLSFCSPGAPYPASLVTSKEIKAEVDRFDYGRGVLWVIFNPCREAMILELMKGYV